MPGEYGAAVFYLRCELCCITPYHCLEQRQSVSIPPSSYISHLAALWSLLALLQCTKPYCGFPEISWEGEKESPGGVRCSPLEAPGISPLSPQKNTAAFPKTLVLRALSPCCPPPAHTHERGDMEIYVMVTQYLPLLNSRLPWLPVRAGESFGVQRESKGRPEVD